MDEKYTSSVFKEWIKNHETKDYQIIENNQDCIELNTDYGKAEIHFTDVTEGTIVEFNIVSYKDQEVKFYLHFELNDEDHAHQLYDEMVETLIELKNKKILKVLLSCSSGLTTSMFASNLNSVVEMLGEDYHFEAVAYTNIYEEVENYDVILIAPQIGYLLKRLKESLPDKLVLQIPTAIFAGYDAIGAIKFIQNEIDQFQKEKKEKQEIKCHCCKHYNRRVLSIVLSGIALLRAESDPNLPARLMNIFIAMQRTRRRFPPSMHRYPVMQSKCISKRTKRGRYTETRILYSKISLQMKIRNMR